MADDVIMTPHVTLDGVKYTLAPWTCGRCTNTFFTADHVEFNPAWCCYCGIRVVWYEDGKTGRNRMRNGRIKPGGAGDGNA